jgi:NAD(P)-dependent dehydrogenase (short-subunit alcohol dehydrogenase family)
VPGSRSTAGTGTRSSPCSPSGGDFVAAPADLTTDDGLDALLAELSQVDILVNNLGIFGAQPALKITDAEWRRYFEASPRKRPAAA